MTALSVRFLVGSFLTLTLMMEYKRVSETLIFNSALTRMIAREDFIAFICRESFKSYINISDVIITDTTHAEQKMETEEAARTTAQHYYIALSNTKTAT
jgi:hypothetical protein